MQPSTTRLDLGSCTLESLEKQFDLQYLLQADFLSDWLNCTVDITTEEQEAARFLQMLLKENALHWNEQELSLHFIGPLFNIVHFTVVMKMNLFAQRYLSADVIDKNGHSITLFGRPDGLIASGYRSPEVPYFAFQEYKKEKDPNGDPGGQCLAAMLAGQALNKESNRPIYGCYVVGENWRFMVLLGTEYAISPAFSAITDEIFYVLGRLKYLKKQISQRIGLS
jgi:hypothetical protein